MNELNEIIELVWLLRQEGDSIAIIADNLKVAKKTIHKFMRTKEYLDFNKNNIANNDTEGKKRVFKKFFDRKFAMRITKRVGS